MLWTLEDYKQSLAILAARPKEVRMRTTLLTLVASSVLLVAVNSCAQERSTAMLWLKQSDCPAALIQTNHTNKDFLQSAVLKNVGKQAIREYRIGWVVVYPSGKSKVGLGLPVRVPDGLKPGETVDVPAQQVSTDFANEGASAVVFFLTDVHLAENNVWKADLESAEQAARKLDLKVRSAS
jgi:hypothetical protein